MLVRLHDLCKWGVDTAAQLYTFNILAPFSSEFWFLSPVIWLVLTTVLCHLQHPLFLVNKRFRLNTKWETCIHSLLQIFLKTHIRLFPHVFSSHISIIWNVTHLLELSDHPHNNVNRNGSKHTPKVPDVHINGQNVVQWWKVLDQRSRWRTGSSILQTVNLKL